MWNGHCPSAGGGISPYVRNGHCLSACPISAPSVNGRFHFQHIARNQPRPPRHSHQCSGHPPLQSVGGKRLLSGFYNSTLGPFQPLGSIARRNPERQWHMGTLPTPPPGKIQGPVLCNLCSPFPSHLGPPPLYHLLQAIVFSVSPLSLSHIKNFPIM